MCVAFKKSRMVVDALCSSLHSPRRFVPCIPLTSSTSAPLVRIRLPGSSYWYEPDRLHSLLSAMAARIQYCSLEEFRKCYMEGVGFKTLGRPQMRTIEARLRKQGKLDKHGWTALRSWGTGTEDASSPRLQWAAMETVISSIQRAAQWAHPKRFGEKKRNAHFESRYRAKMAPFQEGVMERAYVDGFTVLKKKAPRGTRPGTAFDVPLISREDKTRGVVYGADIGVAVCWDSRDDDDNAAMRVRRHPVCTYMQITIFSRTPSSTLEPQASSSTMIAAAHSSSP